MSKNPSALQIDFTTIAIGFALGIGLMAILVGIGLVVGCSPSIEFGVPHQ
jgi:hypothetical protein